jgi:hypothetical protein
MSTPVRFLKNIKTHERTRLKELNARAYFGHPHDFHIEQLTEDEKREFDILMLKTYYARAQRADLQTYTWMMERFEQQRVDLSV